MSQKNDNANSKKILLFVYLIIFSVALTLLLGFLQKSQPQEIVLQEVVIKNNNIKFLFSKELGDGLSVDFNISRYETDNFKWIHFNDSHFGDRLLFNPEIDGNFFCNSRYETDCNAKNYRGEILNSMKKYGLDSLLIELRVCSEKFDPKTLSNELLFCRVVKGYIRSSQIPTEE